MKTSKSPSAPSKERQVAFFIVWLIRLIVEAIKSRKSDTAQKKVPN